METHVVAVVGATSDVGSVVVSELEAKGVEVRRISRTDGVDIHDAPALVKALTGADSAYVMLPFDMAAPDLHARETELAAIIADALKQTGVKRVVSLSTASAHLKNNTGSGRAGGILEEHLDAIGIPELTHLRAAFFMENFAKGMNFAAQADTGVYSSAFNGDRPIAMVAAEDIGVVAAEILSAATFQEPHVRELLGPRDYTLQEAIAILSAAYGNPAVKYKQGTYEETRAAMLSLGVSESFADAVVETAKSFNRGDTWWQEARSRQNTTPTTLEAFAKKLYRKD